MNPISQKITSKFTIDKSMKNSLICAMLVSVMTVIADHPIFAATTIKPCCAKVSKPILLAQNSQPFKFVKSLDNLQGGFPFFLDSDRGYLGTSSSRFNIYNWQSEQMISRFPEGNIGSMARFGSVTSIAMGPRWETMAVNDSNGTLAIYRPNTGELLHEVKSFVTENRAIVYGGSKSGQLLLAGQEDGKIRVIDANMGKIGGFIKYADTPVQELAIDSDENRFLAARYLWDGVVVWDLLTDRKNPILVIPFPALPYGGLSPSSIALNSNGSLLAIGFGNSDVIRLYSVKSGNILYEFPPLRSIGVKSLKFSPDNRYLVSGHIYQGFRVWDIKTKKLVQQVKGRGRGIGSDTVSQIEFSPDGTLLFTLDDGNKIGIWKLQD